MSEFVQDVATVVSLAKLRNPGLPTFLLGHSAGGVVSCLYVLEHQSELAGFICESFAFEVPAPDFAIAALKGLSHLAPHAHVLKLHNEDFSRDPAVVKAMNDDPLIANETQPTRTVAELARADERLRAEFSAITLPLLILHGTADMATKPSGSQTFYDAAGSDDKTIEFYQGHYHDLLNDVGHEEVLADIVEWIEAHVRGRV
jgi:alpha-beta hydrolase superfamily lysophospholipase